jgi:hypothetical protein
MPKRSQTSANVFSADLCVTATPFGVPVDPEV